MSDVTASCAIRRRRDVIEIGFQTTGARRKYTCIYIYISDNKRRKLTVDLYYQPHKVYYIALKPDTFAKHISSYVGSMMDVYDGYCTLANHKMMQFESERACCAVRR